MASYSCVALVPIKAHSSRIQQKNFRLLLGKPLFRWILDTLLSLQEVERVVINTDARGILKAHGLVDSVRVVIRDRNPDLRGDSVSMNRVLADDVLNVESRCYLMTHTTNPLLRAETIREAIQAYSEGTASGRCDSLFSVNRHQTRFYRADGTPVNHDPANLIPTQNLEAWFEENSNLYVFSRESFLATNARIGRKPMMFVTPRVESTDIDDQESWNLVEVLAQSLAAAWSPRPNGIRGCP